MNRNLSQHGFTLLELMVGLTILAVLAGTVVPSILQSVERGRVRGAAEVTYSQLKWARSEAIKRGTPIFVSEMPTANWCYGFSEAAYCDCSTNSCFIDSATNTKRVTASNHTNVNFATSYGVQAGAIRGFTFNKNGEPSTTGTLTFSSGAATSVVTVNILGNVSITGP